MEDILDDVHYEGPTVFPADRVAETSDLFRSRAALFYTPTENIPTGYIGTGPLDVELPIAFPTTFDVEQNRACWCPRMWVDLIQRATGKIRWTPMIPATVHLVRYDYTTYGEHNLSGGVKGLLDSLKYNSTGRRDGHLVFYFGVIRDDNSRDLNSLQLSQERVNAASDARTRIIVLLAS